jgi:hypothetical protein
VDPEGLMAAGYRYYVGDLRTGKITRPVALVDGSWSLPLGEPGSVEGSFPLRSGEWKTARSDTAPAKSFLAVAYENAAGDETMLEAGPIWKSDYDDSSGVIKFAASGLHSYFDHRKVLPVLAAGETAQDVSKTYEAANLALVAKRLVELAQSHVGGSLPIVLPSDAELGGAGTAYEEVFPGYELSWVGDRIKQLAEKGDFEIQFVPRRRTDDRRYIEWVMRIGSPATSGLLFQTGNPWTWDMRPEKHDVRSLGISTDATKMAFRQWAAGQGQAEGRPVAMAQDLTLVNAGFALVEGEVSATDTEDDPQPFADAALAYSQRPIESWNASVSRDGKTITVGQLRPGDWARYWIADHAYLPDGKYEMRLLSIAGNTSDVVSLTLSERLGEL